MIITLKGAGNSFETNRIGVLDKWNITRVIDTGVTYSGPTSVDKGASFSATLTLKSNYEYLNGVTVTMGGNPVTSGINTSGNTTTITINSVTGNITINGLTRDLTGNTTTPTTYTITYKYMCGSTSVKTQETETVTAGTVKNFATTDSRATVSGYTCTAVSQASATINSNITVTYTYTANATSGDEMAAGTYTYNNAGYVQAATGKIVTGGTWIHSDFIPVAQLANGDDSKCVRTFTGHGTVAAIAFYKTKDNFDSWVSSITTNEITGGATSVTAEYVKSLAPTEGNYVVFSTDGSKQTLSVTVGSGSGEDSSEPEEPDTPVTSGINYYTNAGFIAVSTGQVTNTTSDWIHSDFIAIDSLVDDATLGHCVGKFTGHSTVADIAFYSSNSFDSYIAGKTSAGSTRTLASLQTLMTELDATNATHIIISTDKTKNQLYASLK